MIKFIAADGQMVLINTDNPSGRMTYQQHYLERWQTLQSISRRLGVDVFQVMTEQTAHAALLDCLQQRQIRAERHR